MCCASWSRRSCSRLLLLTFALEIPPILQHGEALIAEGASWDVVVRVLATLVPQALGITIPMALLVGMLIALGRLSGDREIVAMEACGVSLGRLLRPLLLFALLATAATTYVMIVALPAANQAFREITFKLLMSRGESKIKPRVFYDGLPESRHLCPRSDTGRRLDRRVRRRQQHSLTDHQLYLAKRGRLLLDEGKRSVSAGARGRHAARRQRPRSPTSTSLATFEQDDARHRSGDGVSARRSDEGLHGDDDRGAQDGHGRARRRRTSIRTTRSWPGRRSTRFLRRVWRSCWSRSGMGVSNRRDGRLASFVLGIAVVFVYWVLMYMSEAIAKAGLLPYWFAWVAMWVPNVVIAIWGALLIAGSCGRRNGRCSSRCRS